jgi:putative ABC transport system ATP-binding protein
VEPVLAFRHLAKKTPDGHKLLFSAVTSQVFPNDSIAIVGASGQGKSTLLRVLARLIPADEGQLTLRGVSAARIPGRQWRMQVGYVSQHAFMLPDTVEDNLRTASRLHRSAFDPEEAKVWMRKIGLESLDWQAAANQLSGGEQQRLALVRSLLLPYDVLLLDEATASLDDTNKHAVERLLDDWQKARGAALIWVTHDREQAYRVASRIWTMEKHTLSESIAIGVDR